jgi:hypothetical protein
MLGSTKIAAGLAGVASMFLIAGTSLSATAASAADGPGAAICTVSGTVGVTPGITIAAVVPPRVDTFTFTTVTIDCTGSDLVTDTPPDDSGPWGVTATGTASDGAASETCAKASGSSTSVSGTGPSTDDHTIQSSSSFTFTRVGTHVHVTGHIDTQNVANNHAETHGFTAELEFTPTNGECSGGSGPTTAANINGTAVVTEGV